TPFIHERGSGRGRLGLTKNAARPGTPPRSPRLRVRNSAALCELRERSGLRVTGSRGGRGGSGGTPSAPSNLRVVFGRRAPHIALDMRYVELRTHSAFSFGDGATTPEALVRRAAEYGYPALGLTDHADLGGVIRFALECERAGLHPVVGAELVVDGHPVALLALDER